MHYFKELPEDYKEVYVVDARDKKTGLKLNIICLAVVIILVEHINHVVPMLRMNLFRNYQYLIGFVVCIVVYLALHEVTHGIAYKIIAPKEKLRFGASLTFAYCGMPNIYVNRCGVIFSSAAPLVVYSIVFLGLFFANINGAISYLSLLMLSLHLGGCVGDIFVILKLIFMGKRDILVKDIGEKQTFYVKVRE